ncbi:uncharacterized protein LOC128678745 [Plodia interpunctella]|uniref:uncharacterized protein LOC128678745 n=1 Tax=Plodia interpunctella TaxID=58824 RepID=UPI0023678685|nr:uncharacterized protein LOC128678745 [Plodia interpunctella]
MIFLLYITSFSLIIHAAQPYILLTANLDDLHNIAKELVQSPVSDQIGSLIRRAYGELQKIDLLRNKHQFQPRAENDEDDFRRNINIEEAKSEIEKTTEPKIINTDEAAKNEKEKEKETYYIKSINKVLENVK